VVGKTRLLKLKLMKVVVKKIVKVFACGKKVKVKMMVKFSDLVGNNKIEKLSVKLKG